MADEKQTLLVFSLGPVQSFIAAARKTEDLWSGSYLLSHLTGVAIRSIQEAAKDKGTLVFLVYPGSRSNNNNNQLDIASLPNRIILRIIHEVQVAAELAESAAKAVRQEFIKLGEYAINKVFDDTVSKTKMITMLEEQIDTLLEIYWALEPVQDERDYDRARLQAEKRMAAVKNFRPYKPYRQNGLVCTLCGEQTALTENGIKSTVNNYAQMKINLVNTWSKRSREYQGVLESLEEDKREGRIKEGEGLCSICLTKRLTRQYFKEHSSAGDKNRYGPFPSIHDIADQSGYYAVIMMDGDDMGKWVSGEKAGLEKIDIAYQQKLSSKLESFASRFVPQEVKKSKGELIYSGGDDVLAFVPQREVISLAKNLRLGFGKHMAEDMESGELEATASMGIVIAHQKAPLSMVLNYARSMEGKAKSYIHPLTGKQKDAIGLALITHSGEIREVILPFSLAGQPYSGDPGECTVSLLYDVLEMIENDLSIQFGEKFANAFLPLVGSDFKEQTKIEIFPDNTSLNHKLISVELRRVMKRSIREGRRIDDLEAKTDALMKLYDVCASLLQFIHLLEICRFLRSKEKMLSKGGEAI